MKVNEWNSIRRKLKVEFERRGVTRCERCGSGMFLGFAHRLKRRFIVTDFEKRCVALLCVKCHEDYEHGGHERMFAEITKLIERRE